MIWGREGWWPQAIQASIDVFNLPFGCASSECRNSTRIKMHKMRLASCLPWKLVRSDLVLHGVAWLVLLLQAVIPRNMLSSGCALVLPSLSEWVSGWVCLHVLCVLEPDQKAWEKVEATLLDLEKSSKASANFLKACQSKSGGGQIDELKLKLEKEVNQAKVTEASQTHTYMH